MLSSALVRSIRDVGVVVSRNTRFDRHIGHLAIREAASDILW